MDVLHSIETPIYLSISLSLYIYIMEQKENKIKCKRKENNVHKRLEINQRVSTKYSMILNNGQIE